MLTRTIDNLQVSGCVVHHLQLFVARRIAQRDRVVGRIIADHRAGLAEVAVRGVLGAGRPEQQVAEKVDALHLWNVLDQLLKKVKKKCVAAVL